MSKIKVMSEQLSNRIAAGEVIERPASVVKELVENAIDAGARHIRIEIEKAGSRLISVEDDGSGMDGDDALLCIEPHFPFRRMDVHIHLLRRHFKVQDHRRETARLIQRRISFADAAVERRGFDRAAVDERALLLARIACEAR